MPTLYDVKLRLSTEGGFDVPTARLGEMARKVGDIHGGFSRIGEVAGAAFERMGSALEGIADKAISVGKSLGMIGATAAIGAATYGVAKLNNELEGARISLGDIFSSQGLAKDMTQGMGMAGDVMAKMRKDAASLPGEFKDLLGIFRATAIPAFQGGLSPDKLREMSAQTMAFAATQKIPMEVAAREMAMLMEGRAGAHNRLGMELAALGGDKAKAFNESSAQARIAMLQKELAKHQESIGVYSKSFDGLFSTMIDNTKQFMGLATAPLFERVKGTLGEINDYFDSHKQKIEEVANTVGRRLVTAWDAIENTFKRIEPIVARIGDRILHMQPAEIGQKLAGAGEMVFGTKLAGMGLQGVGGLLGSAGKLAPFLGGVEGGAGGAMAAAGPFAAGMAALAGTALMGLGVAIHDLIDPTAAFHDEAVQLAESIKTHASAAFEKLGKIADEIHLEKFVDQMGIQFLFAVEQSAKALEFFADTIIKVGDFATSVVGTVQKALANIGLAPQSMAADNPGMPNIDHAYEMFRTPGGIARAIKEQDAEKMRQAARAAPSVHVNQILIQVSGNNDPSRVARLTKEQLAQWAKNPKKSPNVPNYEAGSHY